MFDALILPSLSELQKWIIQMKSSFFVFLPYHPKFHFSHLNGIKK